MGIILKSYLIEKRPEIMDRLKSLGIGTSIYYPHPVPHMSYYRDRYGTIDCSNAELISNSIIALPVGPHLDLDDMQTIANGLASILNEIN
jgi:dTDP-4-amino-4,6-dideoxygalactose transaminase